MPLLLFLLLIIIHPVASLCLQVKDKHTNDASMKLPYSRVVSDLAVRDAGLSQEPLKLSDTSQPTVYMTFDDGPQKGTNIVSHLAVEEKIPVTFFMVGLHVEVAGGELLSTYRNVKRNPFAQILNHSYTHGFRNKFAAYYQDVKGAFADIEKSQRYLKLDHKIVRLPGSNVWRTPHRNRDFPFKLRPVLGDSLVAHGYSIIGWDEEWHFNYRSLVLKETPQQIANTIERMIKERKTMHHNHFVLLTHERSFSTKAGKQALIDLIHTLKKQGYRFAFTSNHPLLYVEREQYRIEEEAVEDTSKGGDNIIKSLLKPHFDKREDKDSGLFRNIPQGHPHDPLQSIFENETSGSLP